jgi:hypothetical protein
MAWPFDEGGLQHGQWNSTLQLDPESNFRRTFEFDLGFGNSVN